MCMSRDNTTFQHNIFHCVDDIKQQVAFCSTQKENTIAHARGVSNEAYLIAMAMIASLPHHHGNGSTLHTGVCGAGTVSSLSTFPLKVPGGGKCRLLKHLCFFLLYLSTFGMKFVCRIMCPRSTAFL